MDFEVLGGHANRGNHLNIFEFLLLKIALMQKNFKTENIRMQKIKVCLPASV